MMTQERMFNSNSEVEIIVRINGEEVLREIEGVVLIPKRAGGEGLLVEGVSTLFMTDPVGIINCQAALAQAVKEEAERMPQVFAIAKLISRVNAGIDDEITNSKE